jgi:hypothetical protein
MNGRYSDFQPGPEAVSAVEEFNPYSRYQRASAEGLARLRARTAASELARAEADEALRLAGTPEPVGVTSRPHGAWADEYVPPQRVLNPVDIKVGETQPEVKLNEGVS